ncbi:hypothetical protein Tco_0052750 [Tanacetum coccineum]
MILKIFSKFNDDDTSVMTDDFDHTERDGEVAIPLLMLITLLPIMISYLFEILCHQEGSLGCDEGIDNSNNTLLELPEFESFHFNPSFLRPPPEPPDVEICLYFNPDATSDDN